MAYELAHCRHDNHSAEFYAEMDVIQTKLYKNAAGTNSDTFSGKPIALGTIICVYHSIVLIHTTLTNSPHPTISKRG